jgi:ATP-dependent Lon protease
VVLPEKNRSDVEEIKDVAIEGLDVQYVKRIDEALGLLLEPEPMDDPAVRFTVSDADRRHAAPPGDGAPVVVSAGTGEGREPEPMVGSS